MKSPKMTSQTWVFKVSFKPVVVFSTILLVKSISWVYLYMLAWRLKSSALENFFPSKAEPMSLSSDACPFSTLSIMLTRLRAVAEGASTCVADEDARDLDDSLNACVLTLLMRALSVLSIWPAFRMISALLMGLTACA